MKKSLVIYSLIFLFVIPIFGFNLILNFLGNILLLIILVPLLIFLITMISLNSLKPKFNICNQCGNISLGINSTCMNCGEKLGDINFEKPSETTIEVKAEKVN